MLKRIQIGSSDFKELIEGNLYFIDKSLLIKEFIVNGAKIILTPRPRRFGKTLNLSMLRYFFDIICFLYNKKLLIVGVSENQAKKQVNTRDYI